VKSLAVAFALAAAGRAGADPPRVSFDDAIRLAIAHNPTRRIAQLDIERTCALLVQASAALLPQVGAGATYTRLEGNRYVAMRRATAANSVMADATLDAPIVDLGAYAQRRRAEDQVEVSAAEAASIARDVAIATARAYFAAFVAARMVELAEHARDTARAHVDYTLERARGGVGNDLDVTRAQTELATDESQLASATTARVRAEAALAVITGSEGALAAGDEPHLEEREGRGVDARADVIAARTQREAADESKHLDWMLWAPTLRLGGDGFYAAPQIDPIPRFGYQLVVALQLPLYDGGLRRGIHDQHRAELAEARERETGTDRQARSDVATAEQAIGNARTARDAAHHAAELAARTLALATEGYRAGTSSELDVIDAERSARDAATQAVIADDDYRQAELDLLAATGAFPWPVPPATP
jgi:outer membrane protein TolC